MKYRVHFKWPNGDEDSFVVEDDSIQGIRDKVVYFFEQRALTLGENYLWSEEEN